MENFWKKLKKPIFALAPLAGITDSAFRQICKEFGADVVYSEMASVAALNYNPEKTIELISYNEKESPYVVQLFGSDPKHFEKALKLIMDKSAIKKLGINNYKLPQGIDINFGCPVPKIAKQKAGAELFKDKKLSREVLKAVLANTDLPVSIKTRTQAGDTKILDFLDYISDLDIKALMIHGRTLKQGFVGPIDTTVIKKSRDYFGGIILANGGVNDLRQAREVLEKTGVDGIGIARGALGRPWLFKDLQNNRNLEIVDYANSKSMSKVILKHARLAYRLKGKQGVVEMRKHLCWYAQGLPGAKKIRSSLVNVTKIKEIEEILKKHKDIIA